MLLLDEVQKESNCKNALGPIVSSRAHLNMRWLVNDAQELDFIAVELHELGDLERNGGSERIAAYAVGTGGLNSLDSIVINVDDLIHGCEERLVVETAGTQSVDRPIGDVARKVHEYEHLTNARVDEEEWSSVAIRLKNNNRIIGFQLYVIEL